MSDAAVASAPEPKTTSATCPACKQEHPGSDATTLAQLARTPARLKALVKGLDAKGLATSYGPGKWSIRQLVCHLRDCELMFGMRWRLILSEERPTLHPFDQDHWADQTRYAKQEAARALATFEQLRAGNLEMLKIAGKPALARVGSHADYGAITIGQMARHLRSHDEKHLTHIETARASRKAARGKKARG